MIGGCWCWKHLQVVPLSICAEEINASLSANQIKPGDDVIVTVVPHDRFGNPSGSFEKQASPRITFAKTGNVGDF